MLKNRRTIDLFVRAQEFRFLLPCLPALHVTAACGLQWLLSLMRPQQREKQERDRGGRGAARGYYMITTLLFLLQYVAALYFIRFHQVYIYIYVYV